MYENENMETTCEETQETVMDTEMDEVGTGLSGKVIAAVVLGGAALIGGGVALVKKLKKDKGEAKPKQKKKFHIGFLPVEEEFEDEFVEEVEVAEVVEAETK